MLGVTESKKSLKHLLGAKRTMKAGKSNLHSKLALLTLFFVVVSGSAVAKDFYRWTDSEGTTHYSETPPKNVSATKVRASNTKMPANGYSPAASPVDTDEQTETGTSAAAAPPASNTDTDSQRCSAARSNAKTLQEKSRIRVKDDNGEYRYLDSEEIAEKLKTALQILDEEC